MKKWGNRGSTGIVAVVIVAVMIVGIVAANQWLQKQTNGIVSEPVGAPAVKASSQKLVVPARKRKGDVIRRTRFSPDRKYEINVFYQEGEEIARNRSTKEGSYDQEGDIPDGKVKFINESNETYGVEYYQNQKKHGSAKLYYNDGVLKKESYYQYGRLVTGTEYYHDGTVRMEEDYANAREHLEGRDVGIGKVYFRDGTLKYEWSLTIAEPIGFEKSYDGRGKLTGEFYFDEYGQPIDSKEMAPDSTVPLTTDDLPGIGVPAAPPTAQKPPKQIFVPAG